MSIYNLYLAISWF